MDGMSEGRQHVGGLRIHTSAFLSRATRCAERLRRALRSSVSGFARELFGGKVPHRRGSRRPNALVNTFRKYLQLKSPSFLVLFYLTFWNNGLQALSIRTFSATMAPL